MAAPDGYLSRVRYVVERSTGALPADLAAAAVWTVVTVLVALLPLIRDTPIRVVLGIPFLLFVPGYVTVAALFPEAGEGPSPEREEGGGEGIDGLERIALSLGLSIAISPLIGLALNFTPWGIRLVPILVGVGGYSLVITAAATQRRRVLPPEDRFHVPYRSWANTVRSDLLAPDTRTDLVLNVLVAVSVILVTASVAYAVTVPNQEGFSEVYLLTETENGDLRSENYPSEFTVGETKPVVVGVGNHEYRQTDYSVVVEIHDVEFHGPNETQVRVLQESELTRFETTLDHNGTDQRVVELSPSMTGSDLRIAFLLYRGSAPADPSFQNAYDEAHLWVDVTA